jgi:hypothetical protein
VDLAGLIDLVRAPETRLPALSFVVQSRRHAISVHVEQMDESEQMRLAEAPVHPLLLCTALAKSAARPAAPDVRVGDYLRGELVSDLEETLLIPDDALSSRELTQLLDLESSLLEDLMILSVGRLFSDDGMSTEFLRELVRDLIENTSNEDIPISVHEARWATWLTTNPSLTVIPFNSETRAALLFAYGFAYNSRFHNALEYYDDHVNSVRSTINAAFSRGSQPDAIADLRARHEVASRLRDRARQFYWWNPIEIDAHAVGESAGEAYRRLVESERTHDE